MKCVNCEAFSFGMICKNCAKILSEFRLCERKFGEFSVYYFYGYSEIKHLIHSKHHEYGQFVFKKLANLSFKKFANEFKFSEICLALGLDDTTANGEYSHTAILAHALKSEFIKPKFGVIKAKNSVKYSGKSLEFRLKNKRDFQILKPVKNPVILVDDIVTTGCSLGQAKEICEKNGIEVLFGLVLANAEI